MKNFGLYAVLSVSLPLSAFAAQNPPATCEDVGATTMTKQVLIDTGVQMVSSGEPQRFCVLVKDQMQSVILESTLLSKNPSLAATAYRTGPKPTVAGGRADRSYCTSLGGTYQFGAVGLIGGWVNDKQDNSSGICVFADGSMVSTWTLFYKRAELNERPDFEAHFQNNIIPGRLW